MDDIAALNEKLPRFGVDKLARMLAQIGLEVRAFMKFVFSFLRETQKSNSSMKTLPDERTAE